MYNPWDDDSEKRASQKEQKNDINQIFSKIFNKENDNTVKPNVPNKKIYILLGVIIAALWLSTGFFKVDADQKGVILRFGKYSRQAEPGLNYKLPSPIEVVEKISVTRIKKDVIGQLTNSIAVSRISLKDIKDTHSSAADLSYPKESQMLTGDENIIDMHFFVQWRINNATNYLFEINDNASDPIVRTSVESIMRQVIGGTNISEALSENRQSIELAVKSDLQTVLNQYKSGVEIIGVGILYSYVAPEVRDAYRDVQSAKADKEKFINHAQAYKKEIIPNARGRGQAVIEEAKAIKNDYIQKAEGESKRFSQVYAAYKASKDITKKRLYLEAMQDIYNNSSDKIIIDDESIKIMPFLPLNKHINN